jgi:hypothetical protein
MKVPEYARCDRPVICASVSDCRSSQSGKYQYESNAMSSLHVPELDRHRASKIWHAFGPTNRRRHPSANSEKSDLGSISALRQKNLVEQR